MTTPVGDGTKPGRGTRRLIPKRRFSTDDSGSGSEGVARRGEITRWYRSIHEQEEELLRKRRKAEWILVSPATCYEIETADSVYIGYSAEKPTTMMVMGLQVKVVPWMPDGLLVVTDTFEDEPLIDPIASWETLMGKGLWGKMPTSKREWERTLSWSPDWKLGTATSSGTSIEDYSFTYDTTTLTDKTITVSTGESSLGTTLYFGHAKTEEEGKSAVDEPIYEISEKVDPRSIYGKALAKAKKESKAK